MKRVVAIAITGTLFGCGLAALPFLPWQPSIKGPAIAIDGDTIVVHNRKVRLAFIDAPEAAQTCGGDRPWACGKAAARALQHMLERSPYVVCTRHTTDRYDRPIATCTNAEGDLAARMVARGLAIRYERYAGEAYRDEQAAAKAEGLGVWGGEFMAPGEWRKRHR